MHCIDVYIKQSNWIPLWHAWGNLTWLYFSWLYFHIVLRLRRTVQRQGVYSFCLGCFISNISSVRFEQHGLIPLTGHLHGLWLPSLVDIDECQASDEPLLLIGISFVGNATFETHGVVLATNAGKGMSDAEFLLTLYIVRTTHRLYMPLIHINSYRTLLVIV